MTSIFSSVAHFFQMICCQINIIKKYNQHLKQMFYMTVCKFMGGFCYVFTLRQSVVSTYKMLFEVLLNYLFFLYFLKLACIAHFFIIGTLPPSMTFNSKFPFLHPKSIMSHPYGLIQKNYKIVYKSQETDLMIVAVLRLALKFKVSSIKKFFTI